MSDIEFYCEFRLKTVDCVLTSLFTNQTEHKTLELFFLYFNITFKFGLKHYKFKVDFSSICL